jgi:hypothetical protein
MWCMPFAPRPGFLLGPLPVSPNDNTGPHSNGFEHRTTVADILASPPHFATPVCTNLCHASHVPPADTNAPSEPPDMIALRPTILDNYGQFPEFSSDSEPPDASGETPEDYGIRSLTRSALRMLWHQRLGHLNFRRLSEMHRFIKGLPQFKIPTEIEECPV